MCKKNKVFSGLDRLPKGLASEQLTEGCVVLEGGAFRGLYTSGVLDALMRGDAPSEVRQALGLNESSRVLLVSTEGDTDQENYQRIINGED